MPRRKRATAGARTEREVTVGAIGVPFVEKGGKVQGTPSNTEGKNRRGVYAASSVIERGTVNKLRATALEADKHECACGCGQSPSQADSVFMPGHDSKVRSMGKAVLEGRIKKAELPAVARQYLEEGGFIQ